MADNKIFRPSATFLLLWFFGVALGTSWVLAFTANLVRQHGRHFSVVLRYMLTRGLLVELICCGCFAALFSFLLARLFPVEINGSGVNGHNAMGSRASLRWQEIETVRPFSLLGLKYLRLYPRPPASPVWIPLFLQDKAGFRAALRQFAPAEHLILKSR